MVVFVEGESAGDEQGRAVGVPIGVEATVGGDYQVFVYCWSGSPTNYALRVHYLAPGERGALPVDDDDGCGCSSIAARPGSTMLVLTFGVAALTRRRRSSGRPDQLPRDRCH